jgi:hypothetical protein
MSKSQSCGDAALSRGRSTCMAMCGAIFFMALLMPAPARGLTGDDKDAAGKDVAKKDDVSKGSDNKTTETSNLPERKLLEQLLQQIQSLQARVAELEAKESAAGPNHPVAPAPAGQPATSAPSTASVPSAPTPAPPPTASIPAHPADIEINEVSPRLHLNAYGDVGFAANDQGPSADHFS